MLLLPFPFFPFSFPVFFVFFLADDNVKKVNTCLMLRHVMMVRNKFNGSWTVRRACSSSSLSHPAGVRFNHLCGRTEKKTKKKKKKKKTSSLMQRVRLRHYLTVFGVAQPCRALRYYTSTGTTATAGSSKTLLTNANKSDSLVVYTGPLLQTVTKLKVLSLGYVFFDQGHALYFCFLEGGAAGFHPSY